MHCCWVTGTHTHTPTHTHLTMHPSIPYVHIYTYSQGCMHAYLRHKSPPILWRCFYSLPHHRTSELDHQTYTNQTEIKEPHYSTAVHRSKPYWHHKYIKKTQVYRQIAVLNVCTGQSWPMLTLPALNSRLLYYSYSNLDLLIWRLDLSSPSSLIYSSSDAPLELHKRPPILSSTKQWPH